MSRTVTPVEDDSKHQVPISSRPSSENEKAMNDMFANASAATDKEHNMTLREGLRLYPKAIAWSALISTLCAMEGYDISLIGNFCESTPSLDSTHALSGVGRAFADLLSDAFEPFNRKYGELTSTGSYEVSASWQAGLSNGAQVGQILGLLGEFLSNELKQVQYGADQW